MNATRSLICAALGVAACTLLGGCFTKPSIGMPDASTLSYDGHSVIGPDCAELERKSLVSNAGFRRPSIAFGCATYSNLAAQIARPADIVTPLPLGPADGAVAAAGVRRYQTDQVTPLDATTTRQQEKP
ncbi:CpaD family pilus assembly lipoprotein [Paraburkholderia sp. PREW-6R]|uniref:CpaD family pilus assembly lipoprotein n=1 Tax=Paraburkholderia sp. PREW-6R TaxID=3141544 RepID=UPI0031F52302